MENARMNRNGDSKQPDFNSMSFDDFDQKPYGVRRLAAAGDFKAAGEAITSYIAANNKKLTPDQRCLLWFHAGQNAAHANKNEEAIEFFKKASETIPDEKNLNQRKYALAKFVGPATEFYLKATIAFINNQIAPDRSNINIMHEALDEIKKISILDYPPTNVVTLPGRVNDMCQAPPGTTYHDIFEMNPSLPPLPGETKWHVLPKDDPKEGEIVAEYRNKLNGLLVSDEEMAKSAFGKESNTAKKFTR
jgi:tetratricopeptide (TPR) repeat protein